MCCSSLFAVPDTLRSASFYIKTFPLVTIISPTLSTGLFYKLLSQRKLIYIGEFTINQCVIDWFFHASLQKSSRTIQYSGILVVVNVIQGA